jgi:hypothetical protein
VRATDSSTAHDTGSRTYSLVITGPTIVKLVSFDAIGYEDGVLIFWQTGGEVNNLGFNLHREEGGKLAPVNSQLIAGSALMVGQGVELGAGYSYRWWDAKPAGPSTRYWIEDIDVNGQTRWNGPFYLSQGEGKQSRLPVRQAKTLTRLSNTETPSVAVESRAALLTSVTSASNAAGQTQTLISSSSNTLKLSVKNEGWYRVTQQELLVAGLAPSVDPRNLQLFVDGKQQAISVTGQEDGHLDPQDTVEFYRTGLDSPYSALRSYYLKPGGQAGLRISSVKSPCELSPPRSVDFTIERRDHQVYLPALLNGDTENFFGAVIASQSVNQTLTVNHLATTAHPATLKVALQGVTSGLHTVSVRLNGEYLGQLVFQGQSMGERSFSISPSLLEEGENQITLCAEGGTSDISLVASLRLTYRHTFTVDDEQLKFTASAGEQLTLDGFISPEVRIFDVTDPYVAQEITGYLSKQERGGYRVNDGINFESSSEQLIPLIPQANRVTHIKRGELDDAGARAALIEAINRGQRLVNYAGHGSVDLWCGGLLGFPDALQLQNRDHLSVFVVMNCLNGYLTHPAFDSLGEALLKSEGGAVAVWASSSMTLAGGQGPMNLMFYRQVFGPEQPRLGEAAIRAKLATSDRDARRTWILLGDPSMRLK